MNGRGPTLAGSFALLLLVTTSCTIERTPEADASPDDPAAAEPFGFGSPASDAFVAALDLDVRPDGAGLPEGSGSVAEGRRVYLAKCAACHGPTGTEGPNDRLVGREPSDFSFGRDRRAVRTVGNYWPWASTVFDYVRRAMPFDAPGSLDPDEVYAAVAYVLYLNEVIPDDAVLDATSLPRIVMPAQDRFYPDDRVGGREVR